MKNKKSIIINAAILIVGIFLGWLFFGGSSSESGEKNHEHTEVAPGLWTCSMHPQIKLPKKGKCPICGMQLIPLVTGTSKNTNLAQIEMSSDALKLANIQTTKVEKSKAEKEIYLQGKVEIDERLLSSQNAHFDGRIEKLYISFVGEKVNKGQRIALVYSTQLVTAQQELFEAMKSKDSYPELFTAAKNKLKLWKLTDTQIEQIIKSGKVQENFPVLAEVSGYVTKRNITLGSQVKLGDVLFEIADLRHLWVVFDAYEKDLAFIKIGNKIEFTISTLGDKSFSAPVKYIDPTVDAITRTVGIRTEVTNYKGLLKPEMFVAGKLLGKTNLKENVLIVPKSAVLWTGKRSVVYVKLPNSKTPIFEFREVELGQRLGNFYIVSSGVEVGEEVVTNGAFSIDAAAQLNSQYSMMNPPFSAIKNKVEDFSNAPDDFKKSIKKILTSYLALNQSFIAGDPISAAKEAKNTLTLTKNTKSKKLNVKAAKFWDENVKKLEAELKKISGTKNIDLQRKSLVPLSNTLILVLKSFKVTQEKVFVQFCPMANELKGAFWISNQKKVVNPYLGSQMPNCGENRDSI